jgi:hypothetical protein
MHSRSTSARRLHTQPEMLVIVVIVMALGSRSATISARDGCDSRDSCDSYGTCVGASARFSGHQLEIDCTHCRLALESRRDHLRYRCSGTHISTARIRNNYKDHTLKVWFSFHDKPDSPEHTDFISDGNANSALC